jgi:hypothetical protein
MTLSFTIPKDYNVPSGVKDGAEFSDLAHFKLDGDKIHIIALGEDSTPIGAKEEKSKPKGAKEAVKEQLAAMEDKKGSVEMEDSGEQYAEGGEEE